MRIAIIVGSTRPGRNGSAVADWVLENAQKRSDATYELVDIADLGLPMLDEPVPASMGLYQNEHTQKWAALVASFDGFVVVTPEYNHGPSGALKNALDFVYGEWNNKAAGFVGYGSVGAVRAVEQLRLIMAELQVATVRAQVVLTLGNDFQNYSVFTPSAGQADSLSTVLDQVVSWSGALATIRG